jgi:hypothetical protein
VQWSKLKSRIKSLIAPEVRDRIDFHVTSYRGSHDGADKVWITVDGRRIFSCKHYPREWAATAAYQSGLSRDEIKPTLAKVEIHGPRDFGNSIRSYLDMPIADALKSPDPIVRAFAIVDRRVGKRTLTKLALSQPEHTLVDAFYQLRRSSTHT